MSTERKWWEPEPRLQWEVFAVDKKGKPAKNVAARRYHPERDPYMVACWFVKLTPNVRANREPTHDQA